MKIAFTSCMDATRVPRQPVWKRIGEKNPDVLLLLGDQIYMDWGFGRPRWLQFIKKDKKKALKAYAEDMHSRYLAQATNEDFVELLRQMAHDNKSVLLTWDDHDFAWNNALGAAAETDKHWVPAEIMAISHALFRQFAAFVKHPVGNYPAMLQAASGPPEHWPTPSKGVETAGLLDHQNVQLPYRMLDTRWYRTARGQGDNSVLGREQRADLVKQVKRPEGLLIVGAGSPLKHTYLFSEQDWVGKPGAVNGHNKPDTYDEFEELLAAAERPVLYLSGDIHRAAWSGRINSTNTAKSQVVQMLASPAAIANAGPKKFPPSFGLITITKKQDLSGAVNMALYTLNPNGTLKSDPLTQSIAYSADGWENSTLDGEAAKDDPYLAAGVIVDKAPMAVLVGLARVGLVAKGNPLSAPLDDWEQIDDCYEEGPPPFGYPEPMLAKVTSAEAGAVTALTLTPAGNFLQQDARQALMEKLIRDAFARARAEGRNSVVFYIHGLGKSPVDAIDQGYALRALYGCEPIVFCWPAGWSEGPIARYIDVFNAKNMGRELVNALREALVTFGECATEFSDLPAVIVARSAGSVLLHETLSGGAINNKLRAVSRIVLSSSAIESGDFDQSTGNAFADPQLDQVVVTVNENDETLKLARLVSKIGPALGLQDPIKAKKRHSHVCYLNFTRSQPVGQLHDYLLLDINDQQKAVNLALLTLKDFQPNHLTTSLKATSGAPNVFEVL